MTDTVIKKFRMLILSAYKELESLASSSNQFTEQFVDDWTQANWELTVEQVLCKPSEYLELYKAGADINDPWSRIVFPEATPTHCIKCESAIKTTDEVEDRISAV